MTTGRWVLAASYSALLVISIILVTQGSKIGVLTGLLLVVSLLVIWREAHQGRTDRGLDNRG